MAEGIPRPLIDELLTRWELTQLKVVVVEGPTDKRFLHLVQGEPYCSDSVRELDVWAVDAIDVPAALINKHGLIGTGAKQRVVAFAREITLTEQRDGFRGIVDRDLDAFIPIDHESAALLYTDYGCMDAYLWTSEVLRRLVIQFRAEVNIAGAQVLRALYQGINSVCSDITAVRIASALHSEWNLTLHNSDKSLVIVGTKIGLDLQKYIEQCKVKKNDIADVKLLVAKIRKEISGKNPLDVLNGHDLLWVLTHALRAFARVPKRTVDEESVAAALVAWGILNDTVMEQKLFTSLTEWSRAAVK